MAVTSHFVPLGRLKKLSVSLQRLVHFITLNHPSCFSSFVSAIPYLEILLSIFPSFSTFATSICQKMCYCYSVFFTFFCSITLTVLPSLSLSSALPLLHALSNPSLLITPLLPSPLPPYPDLSSLA